MYRGGRKVGSAREYEQGQQEKSRLGIGREGANLNGIRIAK